MEPLITVITPIYNMEAYLSRCLDSVLNNTYRSLEVICVDDGSQDGCLCGEGQPHRTDLQGKRRGELRPERRARPDDGGVRQLY